MPFVEGVLAVAVASLLSWYLRDDLVATRLLLFWVASAYAAWRGGLWPALIASLLGVVMANYTTTQPLGNFTAPTAPEIFSAVVFVFVTSLLGLTFDRLRRARAHAEDTSRQLAEAAQQLQDQAVELEHQLEQAAHGMSDAMLVFDASWRLVFGNAAAASLLKRVGKDVRALQGRIVWNDLPLLAAEEIQCVLRGAALEKRVVEQDLRYEPADLWLHVRGVPTGDGGLATFIQDRTAARSAE